MVSAEADGSGRTNHSGSTMSVAVIGGGISGLAAAYKLKSSGLNVTLFEAEKRAGGKIRSGSENGLIWDEGANTMTESEWEVGRLIDTLGLREKLQIPKAQSKRYIVRNGTPQLIPTNPVALLTSNFLSAQSKVKILLEPLLWKNSVRKQPSEMSQVTEQNLQESVGHFFQRHFGEEVVDYLIDPFVAGTNAGDPETLSVRHAFPELWNIEKKFGSLLIGAIRSKKSSKPKDNEAKYGKKRQHGSFSFCGGMQTLTDKLCEEVGVGNVQLNSKVLSLCCSYSGSSPLTNWSISYGANDGKNAVKKDQPFDAVIMTAPLRNVQEMKFMKGKNKFMLDFLPKINYLPLSVLITSFKKDTVKKPLEGFGVLVPSKEQKNGLKTLGTLFSSMMFPDRAPSDQYLYTTFVGGSRNKDLAGASVDELKEIVASDLRKLLGTDGQPTFVKHIYWRNAFPLYDLDYDLVIKAIEKMEANLPGLFYAGNHRDGLSVGKAITSGVKAADRVVSYLNIGSKQDA
ncbi:protoporphyrinogen oxidase, mitochondrial-like isoform X1 [Zingiber officinale]|uniref:protoporphyrinogen oxidase, mitochondrial-like isoform X1 n=2 Tax=Zingiber officinale TaxID=94328 RepID=UPI001C4AA744|nr:protoporphyrinogen oxidase, mitochondrial-like isoform X1 [Zingiber officinale]